MGFLKRLWGYITTLFRRTAEGAMNPEIDDADRLEVGQALRYPEPTEACAAAPHTRSKKG